MPTFPRELMPRTASYPTSPSGLVSVGQTGRIQARGTAQRGRQWTETWPDLRAGAAETETLLAWIAWAHASQLAYDVTHPRLAGSGIAPRGAGGGTPVVDGAGQTGDQLATRGWSASVTGVVRAGDVIALAGSTLVYQVVSDADSDGLGDAVLQISPPLIIGSSPADGAAIQTTGVTFRARLVAAPDLPSAAPAEVYAGLSVTHREAP